MENLNRARRCIRLEAQLEIGILSPQLLGLCPPVEAELVLDTMMKLFKDRTIALLHPPKCQCRPEFLSNEQVVQKIELMAKGESQWQNQRMVLEAAQQDVSSPSPRG